MAGGVTFKQAWLTDEFSVSWAAGESKSSKAISRVLSEIRVLSIMCEMGALKKSTSLTIF